MRSHKHRVRRDLAHIAPEQKPRPVRAGAHAEHIEAGIDQKRQHHLPDPFFQESGETLLPPGQQQGTADQHEQQVAVDAEHAEGLQDQIPFHLMGQRQRFRFRHVQRHHHHRRQRPQGVKPEGPAAGCIARGSSCGSSRGSSRFFQTSGACFRGGGLTAAAPRLRCQGFRCQGFCCQGFHLRNNTRPQDKQDQQKLQQTAACHQLPGRAGRRQGLPGHCFHGSKPELRADVQPQTIIRTRRDPHQGRLCPVHQVLFRPVKAVKGAV